MRTVYFTGKTFFTRFTYERHTRITHIESLHFMKRLQLQDTCNM